MKQLSNIAHEKGCLLEMDLLKCMIAIMIMIIRVFNVKSVALICVLVRLFTSRLQEIHIIKYVSPQ